MLACDQRAGETEYGNLAAAEEVAVQRFLAQQVLLRDGKCFRVVESKLASHPLSDPLLDCAATV
jgi:1-deoxy-D-xylulose 5-phosphate reductoisomerase